MPSTDSKRVDKCSKTSSCHASWMFKSKTFGPIRRGPYCHFYRTSIRINMMFNFNLLSGSPFLVLTTCVPRFSQQTYLFSLVFNLLILCRKRDARRYEKRSFGGLQPLTMLMFSQLVGSHTYTPIISTYLGTKTTFFLSGQPL